MPNMSYCRFSNTLSDLKDCLDALNNSSVQELEENASQYERPNIKALILLCKQIAQEFGENIE